MASPLRVKNTAYFDIAATPSTNGHLGFLLVEHDEPGERRQPLVPADQARPLVVLLKMGGERWNQDQVQGSVTEHPIGDVDTAAVDIPNLGTSHRATRNAASRWTYQLHRVAWMASCLSSSPQQIPQLLGLDAAAGHGGIDAAPAPPVDRLQAQVGQRRDRGGAQQRVAKLEQRIGAAGEAGVQLAPEAAEPRQGEGWHRHDRAA
jgi:hypothetical protein